ncbi:hypothetical protein DL766_007039 [Monosporascus sp. MC13-8B]|nr:hypothetical protein DL763_008040 [Monosporascus cannonballus]RYP25489.1 hypothetical protein DL766_007039 [Monosporascus sp. MC13-8B]
MASSSAPDAPADPIRISKIAGRYLVFDIEDAMRLRRRHSMCGVFAGTIPQNPQQNVFMGLPMELLAEEALVLVSLGVAYVVDDGVFHPARLASLARSLRRSREGGGRVGDNIGGGDNDEDEGEDCDAEAAAATRAYLDDIRRERKNVEDEAAEQMRQARLRQARHVKKAKTGKSPSLSKQTAQASASEDGVGLGSSDSLFNPPSDPTTSPSNPAKPTIAAVKVEPRQIWNITPTTSGALLTPPPEPSSFPSSSTFPSPSSRAPAPVSADGTTSTTAVSAPSSWPLYAHLHARGYYMMPGLRFGCDYNVYPGDPLRFHSHFQATCYGWDEEIAMLDLVAGGRLGTNVKKGFLVGGVVLPEDEDEDEDENGGGGVKSGHLPDVRAFCIEWAGM